MTLSADDESVKTVRVRGRPCLVRRASMRKCDHSLMRRSCVATSSVEPCFTSHSYMALPSPVEPHPGAPGRSRMQRARAGSFSHSTWLMMKEATTPLRKARRVRYLAYRSSKNSTSDMPSSSSQNPVPVSLKWILNSGREIGSEKIAAQSVPAAARNLRSQSAITRRSVGLRCLSG